VETLSVLSSAQYQVCAQQLRVAAAKVKLAAGASDPIAEASFRLGVAGARVRREMAVDRDELDRMFVKLSVLAEVLESRVAPALVYEDQVAAYEVALVAYRRSVALSGAANGRAGAVGLFTVPVRPVPLSFLLHD
jgi:hypothetical protein